MQLIPGLDVAQCWNLIIIQGMKINHSSVSQKKSENLGSLNPMQIPGFFNPIPRQDIAPCWSLLHAKNKTIHSGIFWKMSKKNF